MTWDSSGDLVPRCFTPVAHPKKRFRTMIASQRYTHLSTGSHPVWIHSWDTYPTRSSLTKAQPILCIVAGQRLSGPILHQLLKRCKKCSTQKKSYKHQPVLKSTQKHTHMPDLPKNSSNCFGKNPHRSAGSSWGSCDLCRVAGARSTGHWGTERSKEPRAAGTRRSTGGAPLVRICLGKYGGKVDINWYMGKCLYK